MLLLRLSILILLAAVIADARRPRQRPSESDDNALEESYNKPKSANRHRPEKPHGAIRPGPGSNPGSKIRKTKGSRLGKKKAVKRARLGGLRRGFGPRRVPKVHKKPPVPSKPRVPKKPNKPKWKLDLDTISSSLDVFNGLVELANHVNELASESDS